jgi:uncharacterized membrane protein
MVKFSFSTQPKIYKYWSVFTFLMGISLVFIMPPFQSADEFNHFYRIYQISEGQFVGEVDSTKTDLGGYIPSSLIAISAPFEPLAFHKSVKTSFDTIQKYLKTPLEKEKKQFHSFPNTARYALTAYLPQVLTFSVLRQFDTPPLWMMYIGRLMTFLVWFLLVNIAIQKTPVFKGLFMCFLLLPASVAINSTLNADVLTNAFYYLIFMFFFRFREKQGRITSLELILFSSIVLLATVNKIVYFPILGLLFLVKSERFGSLKRKILYISSNVLVNLAVAVLLSQFIHGLIYPEAGNIYHTTYESMRPDYHVNPDLQTQRILERPIFFLTNLVTQSIGTVNNSLCSWVGYFGWESVIPNGLGVFLCILLAFFALFNDYKFKLWERCFLPLIALSMTMLFLLSQHLHWDAVGDYILNDFIGKYFIPIFPLYYWSISGLLAPFVQKNKRFFYGFNVLTVISFMVIYVDFWILVIGRYYIST